MSSVSHRSSTVIVQMTDPHIVANARLCLNTIDTSSFLREAIDTVKSLTVRPDAVLITGDLVNDGRPNQYEHLRVLLAALDVPLYLMPGNHDVRAALRAEFPEHRELGRGPTCDFAINIGALRLVGLDTVVEGEAGGNLSASQLQWLDDQLAKHNKRPTLIAMHHPPFVTGIKHMDAQGLHPDACAALAQVVAKHGHVERVTCGHLHRSITRRWAGTVVGTVPSVAHAVAFDLRPDGPSAWNYEPPSITVHQWNGESLLTHHVGSGDFPANRYGNYD